MRLCHSFWTAPLGINCYDVSALKRLIGNIWYFSLSVAYAKASGAEIVLHTDTLGKALLGHLPYDKIYLTLDKIGYGISPRFWAQGKIAAQEVEPLGSVHIDGDVFIKRPELMRSMEQSEWDVIGQGVELYPQCYVQAAKEYSPVFDVLDAMGYDREEGAGLCCGVVGFRDSALKKEYIDGYRRLATTFSNRCRTELEENKWITPDIVAEQAWLYQLSIRRGAKIHCVLKNNTGEEAKSIGYQHVLTCDKFGHLDRVKSILRQKFPEIYKLTYRLCKNI